MMSEAPRPLVLIVDDQEIMLQFCERLLGDEFRFLRVADAVAAKQVLAQRDDIAGMLLDRDFSHADPTRLIGPVPDVRREGLHILQWLRADYPRLPVLMVTGHRDQQAALEAADLRADYLVWNDVVADAQILLARLRRAMHADSGEADEAMQAFRARGVIGESPEFRRMLVALYRVAFDESPVLLLGETGTGKDVLAAAVHFLSRDHTRPFVHVNVATLAPSLIESELFGHERGAFTDARTARPGLLRLAHNGTLFLNEIADLAPELQAKLLTVLERREVVPVGGERPVPTHFRLIAATSRDLHRLTENGQFRRDLYYRLAWNTVEIPPLRERRDDIPRLVQHCLQRIAARGGTVTSLTREASAHLQSLDWHGNVRELEAVVEAACAAADYVVTLMDVNDVIARNEGRRRPGAAWYDGGEVGAGTVDTALALSLPDDRKKNEELLFREIDFETLRYRYVNCLLRLTGNNVRRVAEISGVGRTTLFEWLRRWRETGGPAAGA
jgi:DNA-binding NtrC family response regulator